GVFDRPPMIRLTLLDGRPPLALGRQHLLARGDVGLGHCPLAAERDLADRELGLELVHRQLQPLKLGSVGHRLLSCAGSRRASPARSRTAAPCPWPAPAARTRPTRGSGRLAAGSAGSAARWSGPGSPRSG